ncbi:UbiA prenyltransferase family protein [Candidatus Shapirobacteria bacterium]|nr:UbiA prenyltransferase family protein [Candidatus Shapirobacteria bacterium]
MNQKIIKAAVRSLRVNQWMKNLAVFAPILFTGHFFDPALFWRTFWTFIVFCLLSSSSYLLNDIIDAPLDRKHPVKKNRPIARGDLSVSLAIGLSIFLVIFGLGLAGFLSLGVFIMGGIFYLLHVAYSFLLKKMVLWDILGIAASFSIRAFAGEVATGYHLSIWLSFTVIFLSLFIASGKRRSELVAEGDKTRPVLDKYQKSLLNFYVSIFSVSTLISYAMFTYFAPAEDYGESLVNRLGPGWSSLVGRKWLMLTLIPVIMGFMRYAYLIFSSRETEQPEKVLTGDYTLLATVLIWGLMLVVIMYVI